MKRVVIFGNSGSGKSTLAAKPSESEQFAHLDLDTLAWNPTSPPERKSLEESQERINAFVNSNERWVIEGCYSDLIEMVLPYCTEIIFLNLSVEQCVDNARNRPWEAHKYASKDAQDANLTMLLDWISQYPLREDTFSQASHQALFSSYPGRKTEFTSNERTR